ncbi:MAG: SRPBCC family protein [Actinobacteria bacterium]|nr:SRPBCC family protein [Actinomycetota bacterium]
MTLLRREIDIAAPREEVYDVLADPACLGAWVTIQEELEEAPEGTLARGDTLRQRMKVAGRRFHLTWKVLQADRPERIVWAGRGPMGTKASATYELSENGSEGTHFSYCNEYALPGGPAGRLAGGAIAKASGREADRTLERLRDLVENRART